MTHAHRSIRRATTITEVIVACSLLGGAMITTNVFQTSVVRSARAIERMAQARREVSNARELVGSWVPDSITESRIVALPIRQELRSVLADARWSAQVKETQQPIEGKRVFIDLVWTSEGQLHSTDGITFWVGQDRTLRNEEDAQP